LIIIFNKWSVIGSYQGSLQIESKTILLVLSKVPTSVGAEIKKVIILAFSYSILSAVERIHKQHVF